jgi:hypothetical protein
MEVVERADTDLQAVVGGWTEALARTRDLTADALALLAHDTRRMCMELRASLARKTLTDLERLWEGSALDWTGSAPAQVAHWLTQRLVTGEPLRPADLAGQLDALLTDHELPGRRVVSALAGLVPAEALPSLLLVPPEPPPAGWLAATARVLAGLVTVVPRLPVALAAEPAALARYLQEAPESHARALVREGLVDLADMPTDIASPLPPSPAGLTEAVVRLAGIEVSEQVAQSFAAAAQAQREPPTPAEDDAARSAAERFLFDLLESLPQTAGRFELNGSLPFRFGTADAEIDLLAHCLGLAIEIDGYYHFRDPEGYRRDRRKDWQLQRRGYLVLRFLAADVVARVEEVLDTVLQAVDHCRRYPQPTRNLPT